MSTMTIEFSRAAYDRAFAAECNVAYPTVNQFEQRLGYRINRTDLEAAARILACPLKVNPPCWQHGRIVYAAARRRLVSGGGLILDIGTAKGFSALCLLWAAMDADLVEESQIVSVDVIDPAQRVRRNTVAEVDGYLTLLETLAPWSEAQRIEFKQSSGVTWLLGNEGAVAVAFIDGKHSYDPVRSELSLLSDRQRRGDVIIADDLQVPGVDRAVSELRGYDIERIVAKPNRIYAVAVKQ